MDDETSERERMDREAIEGILGKRLPQDWPPEALPVGSRVRVVQDPSWKGPWAQVFAGTISDMAAAELVVHPHANPGELKYWVDFDEPQLDAQGDGPYRKAQIWGRYLEPV